MYAIVKTGGKQYKVAVGDKLNVEKLDAEVGEEVELPVICTVDGTTVVADPEKASATKVVATVVEQFRDKKVVVFKFKKRKNYKKKRGHRQYLTRIEIKSIGDSVIEKTASADKGKTEEKAAADKGKTEEAGSVAESATE